MSIEALWRTSVDYIKDRLHNNNKGNVLDVCYLLVAFRDTYASQIVLRDKKSGQS